MRYTVLLCPPAHDCLDSLFSATKMRWMPSIPSTQCLEGGRPRRRWTACCASSMTTAGPKGTFTRCSAHADQGTRSSGWSVMKAIIGVPCALPGHSHISARVFLCGPLITRNHDIWARVPRSLFLAPHAQIYECSTLSIPHFQSRLEAYIRVLQRFPHALAESNR